MKNLGQFFDYQRFFEGKKLVVTDNQPYVDFNTKETLGRVIEVGIMEDNTHYQPSAKGNVTTNLLEKFKVKVLDDGKGSMEKYSRIPTSTVVTFNKFSKANLYVDTNGKMPVMAMSLECYEVAEKK